MKVNKAFSTKEQMTEAQRELLASLLQAEGIETPAQRQMRRRKEDEPLRLSFAQQRLWLLDQIDPGSPAYTVFKFFRLKGELNVPALERALNEIVHRHESLRTVFTIEDGNPLQIVNAFVPSQLPIVSLSDVDPAAREEAAGRIALEETESPFNLTMGPLFRAKLLRLAGDDHALLTTMHHIISDGWSLAVFSRELSRLYESYCHDKPSPLPELPIQYADFALSQRDYLQGEILESQVRYWRDQLEGAPPLLHLPLDHPRPPVQSSAGNFEVVEFDEGLTQSLKQISREQQCTLYMTLLAAFTVLLSRYGRQTDIVVGSPIAGRDHPELEPLIGFFVNTLVMRVDCSGDPTFRQLQERVRAVCLGAFAHQDVPFEKLVEELEPDRSLSYSPIFQVMFAVHNIPHEEMRLGEVKISNLILDRVSSKFDLSLVMKETSKGLQGSLSYNSDIFEAETIRRLGGHWQVLLAGLANRPDARISELPILTPPEMHELLIEWNQNTANFPQGRCLHQLFEAQVERTPEATALVSADRQISYRELNARANRLAHYLERQGVLTEERVGILLDRSIEMVTAMLAVLKAGGAYVPLDAAYPQQRISFMLADAGIRLLITKRELLDGLSLEDRPGSICLVEHQADVAQQSADNPINKAQPENLAYIIYTSGSTGQPKGVGIEHRGVEPLLYWARDQFTPEELSGMLASTSICFDLSVFEIFAPLSWGGKVVLADNVLSLAEQTLSGPIRVINTVPSAISELLKAGVIPESVCTINLAGEALSGQLVEQIYKETSVKRVWNLYGPTEDTTYSTAAVIPHDADRNPSIGRPIWQTQAYILDQFLRPTPVGIVGELFLGGAGLARGYLNRPDLTAERFIPDPFSSTAGARLYRTGDLVRYLPDGKIDYVGRVDQQIKLKGYRIELGEIEASLNKHESIKEAVVVVNETYEGKRLIAYVVAKDGLELKTVELRGYLQQILPPYMIPQIFVCLPQIPLTANGKLDRRALPEPDGARLLEVTAEERALTPIEEIVAAVWREVLHIERVGVEDNFFEAGGHSLLAMQVISRLREMLKVEAPLRAMFEAPTVELLAQWLVVHESEPGRTEQIAQLVRRIMLEKPGAWLDADFQNYALPDAKALPANPIIRGDSSEVSVSIQQESGLLSSQWSQFLVLSAALSARSRLFYLAGSQVLQLVSRVTRSRRQRHGTRQKNVLSPRINRNRVRIQKGISWLANLVIPDAEKSAGRKRLHIPLILRWRGVLNMAALEAALSEIIRRHEQLRARFFVENGRPVAKLDPAGPVSLPVTDLGPLGEAERETEALRLIHEEVQRPFDFAARPLLRMSLLKLKQDEHILCIVVHHFVSDGFSLDILGRELTSLYESFSRGMPSSLPEPPIRYSDFASWQREWLQGEVLERMISFWDRHLTGVGMVPELELPFAGPRPTVTSYRGATESRGMPESLCKRLKELTYKQNVTMYMLVLTALKVLLHHYTGKEYIGVMTPFANRIRPETRSIIGWVQHTLILNTHISGNPKFSELLARVRQECLDAYQHQEIPYSKIFAELLTRQKDHSLLLRLPRVPFVLFDFDTRRPAFQISALSVSRVNIPITSSSTGIAVRGVEYGGKIYVHVTYETDVYPAADVRRMLEHFELLLEGIAADPEKPIDVLSRAAVKGEFKSRS